MNDGLGGWRILGAAGAEDDGIARLLGEVEGIGHIERVVIARLHGRDAKTAVPEIPGIVATTVFDAVSITDTRYPRLYANGAA